MHSNCPDGCDHDPEDQDPGPGQNETPEDEEGKWATIRAAIARWGTTTRLATILLVIEVPPLLAAVLVQQLHAH